MTNSGYFSRIVRIIKKDIFLLPTLILVQFYFIIRDLSINPDPHHDGVIYAAAIAVRDGLIPNRDAFAQYGPLSPFLYGHWMKLTGSSLFNTMILTSILISIISAMMFKLTYKYLGKTLASLISTTWALHIVSRIPWPSLVTTFLVLSILLILNFQSPGADKLNNIYSYRFFLAGLVAPVSILGRVQLLLFVFVLTIGLLILAINSSIYKNFNSFLSGLICSLFLIYVIFAKNNIWQSYFHQTIKWAWGTYGRNESGYFSYNLSYFTSIAWYPIITVFILGLFLIATKLKLVLNKIFISCIIVILVFAVYFISKIPREGYLSYKNPKIVLIDGANNLLQFTGYLSVTLVLYMFILKILFPLYKKPLEIFKAINMDSIGLCLGVSVIGQLFPLHDSIHLWYITPICLIVVIPYIYKSTMLLKDPKTNVVILLTSLLFVLIYQLQVNQSGSFYKFMDKSLQGMSSNLPYAENLDETLLAISRNIKTRSTLFECNHGLYAAAGAKFLSFNNQFVAWGPKDLKNNTLAPDFLFICDISINRIKLKQREGWDPIFTIQNLYIPENFRDSFNVIFRKGSI